MKMIMEGEVYTQFKRPDEDVFEEHPDEGQVERAGYVETEKLVNNLMIAGEKLEIYRMSEGLEIDFDQRAEIVFSNELDVIREYKDVLEDLYEQKKKAEAEEEVRIAKEKKENDEKIFKEAVEAEIENRKKNTSGAAATEVNNAS